MTAGKRRVVVTGLGMVSPVGLNVKESWSSILAGHSGVGPITAFDASELPVRIAAEVKGFDGSEFLPRKDLKKMDLFIQYSIAAGVEAMQDSGYEVTDANAERIGVNIGSGMGGLVMIQEGISNLVQKGHRRITPFFVPATIINMASGNLSIKLGLKGPNLAMVTACASGSHAIGDSARLIACGDVDAMIAGGAESPISGIGISGFSQAKALSTRNDDPTAASRPWDRDRDGFVLGEGAGLVFLEEYEQARARGAHIYAELIGFGMSGDAHHMTSPSPSGEGAARCMKNALRDAELNPEDIQYINAHGTSTPAGDQAETAAAKTVYGDHVYKLAMSSTKSMTGHGMGAAGGFEAVFCALALRDQVMPATINLDNPGPDQDLDYVAHTARDAKLDVVMSNSFGFGGTNATVILKKLD